ncbi:MAG: Crp/Fnr family transcriptional regulator, partial [Saprospiraceae bacterium]|nr:Crp/Fnr family transcriptional regulator [Saprospiraceae bacterium]
MAKETEVPGPQWLQSKVRRYITLTDEEAVTFWSFFKKQNLKNKELLLKVGAVCEYFALVTDGCLMNYYVDENGFEHVLQFATPMWWTADLNSLINGVPSNYSIRALTASKVLLLSKSDLDELYRKVPATERYFRIIFQNSLIAHQQRIMRNHAYNAEERYRQF